MEREGTLSKPVAPKMILARSLDEARSGTFMYVDRHGRVRSVARYRAMQAVGYVAVGATVALPVAYGLLLGPIGAALGLGLSGFLGLRIRNGRRLRRAAVLLAHDRIDEATELLQSIVGGRFVPREHRAIAYVNLATCCALRGDHQTALGLTRKAREVAGGGWRRSVHATLTTYQEILYLVELDRARDARAALDAAGPAPAGEYTLVLHWTAELYMFMAEGQCPLDDEELYDRARKALAMTTGAKLLGLTAWAYAARDNHDMAEHTLHEAFDRMEGDRLSRSMPRLYRWMQAYRDEHPPADEFL